MTLDEEKEMEDVRFGTLLERTTEPNGPPRHSCPFVVMAAARRGGKPCELVSPTPAGDERSEGRKATPPAPAPHRSDGLLSVPHHARTRHTPRAQEESESGHTRPRRTERQAQPAIPPRDPRKIDKLPEGHAENDLFFFLRFKKLTFASLPILFLPRIPRSPPQTSSLLFSHAPRPAPPFHGPHGRRRERPPPHREAPFGSVGSSGSPSSVAIVTDAAARLLLPHPQLGHAPPAPLHKERPCPGATARGAGDPLPRQGEAPPPRGRRRLAAAPARPAVSVEPPHPPLRHRRAALAGGIGRRGRGGGGARPGARGREQEAGVLYRAVQAGDRRGLRVDPRDSAPAPAQEATARGAAAARLAVPRIVPCRCDAGFVQDRREVIGAFGLWWSFKLKEGFRCLICPLFFL